MGAVRTRRQAGGSGAGNESGSGSSGESKAGSGESRGKNQAEWLAQEEAQWETKVAADIAQHAVDAPIMRGVDAKANADRLVEEYLKDYERVTHVRPKPEALKAAEAELRALPLVHGTSIAGALGALDEGLQSHADIVVRAAEFQEQAADLQAEIEATAIGQIPDDYRYWSAEDIKSAFKDSIAVTRKPWKERFWSCGGSSKSCMGRRIPPTRRSGWTVSCS